MSDQPAPSAPSQAPPATIPATPTAAAAYSAPSAAPSSPSLRRVFLINGVVLLVLLLIGLGAFYLWHQSYYFYSTDDATVSGAMVSAAPPASGAIVAVDHAMGDTVRKGATIALLRAGRGTVRVTSPINGTILQMGATPGEVLAAGQPLAQVVDLGSTYITAYVEETHIADVHAGQGVDVTVDDVPGTTFHGRVSRIVPVAASALSLLPTTDFASGNFTKVTQRIPVEITLDGYQGHTLYPGTSASVTIHIHE